jgi:hypothetical protein
MVISARMVPDHSGDMKGVLASMFVREHSHDTVQALGDRSFPPIGIVRRKKRSDRGLGNQRLRFALTVSIGLQVGEYLRIQVDAELRLFHLARS